VDFSGAAFLVEFVIRSHYLHGETLGKKRTKKILRIISTLKCTIFAVMTCMGKKTLGGGGLILKSSLGTHMYIRSNYLRRKTLGDKKKEKKSKANSILFCFICKCAISVGIACIGKLWGKLRLILTEVQS